MPIYVCTDHDGHYPVPVASVIVASDEGEARRLLRDKLREHGLKEGPFTLREVNILRPHVLMLSDGDY